MVKGEVRSSSIRPPPGGASRTPNQSLVEAKNRDIACRAFELYCKRGCQDGHDTDDWLEAERELRGTAISTVA